MPDDTSSAAPAWRKSRRQFVGTLLTRLIGCAGGVPIAPVLRIRLLCSPPPMGWTGRETGMAEMELKENFAVAQRIRAAARRGTLSHALLFTGAGGRVEAARLAAAAMECTADAGKPCGACNACRKVFGNIHPDVIFVRDEAHKNLAVDVVRSVRSDAYVRPNEGNRKVYIFEDCALLTEQDQNVLLKIVEEGPPYAAFLFCAENPSAVLPTLRSRCVELKMRPGGETQAEQMLAAEELCRAVGRKQPGLAVEVLVGLEKKKLSREELQTVLEQAHALFTQGLLTLYGQIAPGNTEETAKFLAKNLTKQQIMHTIELLQTYRRECAYHVGVNHVLGALAVELEDIL